MKEEIREGIEGILGALYNFHLDGNAYAKEIIEFLHSKGVVIKTGGEWCIQHGYPIPCYKCGAKHGQAAVEDLI